MTRPLNIIIDLDNTLFCNDIVDKACARKGVEKTDRHDLSNLPQDVQDECWKNFEDPKVMCSLKPFDDVVGIDKLLKDKGHRVVVLSSRSHNLYPGTVQMMRKHFPHVDEIMLIESYDKKQAYIDLNADVVVDDHGEHILQALDAGVRYVMMVSTERTKYNHSYIDQVKARGAEVFESARCLEPFVLLHEAMEKFD